MFKVFSKEISFTIIIDSMMIRCHNFADYIYFEIYCWLEYDGLSRIV